MSTLLCFWRRKRDLNPRAGYPTYSLSRGAPSPLGYFSTCKVTKNMKMEKQGVKPAWKSNWRRGRDSNPWSLARSLVFKTSSINHSDTPPWSVPQKCFSSKRTSQHLRVWERSFRFATSDIIPDLFFHVKLFFFFLLRFFNPVFSCISRAAVSW